MKNEEKVQRRECALLPGEWNLTIKQRIKQDSDARVMYEFLIEYQTATPPPKIEDLPEILQPLADEYTRQLDIMKEEAEKNRQKHLDALKEANEAKRRLKQMQCKSNANAVL